MSAAVNTMLPRSVAARVIFALIPMIHHKSGLRRGKRLILGCSLFCKICAAERGPCSLFIGRQPVCQGQSGAAHRALADNPESLQSLSPGLRAASYPGLNDPKID